MPYSSDQVRDGKLVVSLSMLVCFINERELDEI